MGRFVSLRARIDDRDLLCRRLVAVERRVNEIENIIVGQDGRQSVLLRRRQQHGNDFAERRRRPRADTIASDPRASSAIAVLPRNPIDLVVFLVQDSKVIGGLPMSERGSGPNPVDVQVGNNVRAKRTAAGLSQDYVANHLGLSLPEYQEYEFGGRRFGAERLLRLARLFGVSPEEFFEGLPGAARRDSFH